MADRDRNRTSTLADVIQDAIKRILSVSHTMMPCKVTTYDPVKQKVSVQPLLKFTPDKTLNEDGILVDGIPELLPIIQGVPVMFPRVSAGAGGPQAHMYFPIKPGTNVMCLFADKSLDKWKTTGGEVDPQDVRFHALSDAVALPGLFSFNNPIPNLDPSDIRIQLLWPDRGIDSEIFIGGDTNDIVIRAGNIVRLGASDAAQSAMLGDLFKAFFDLHVHPTGVGPSGVPSVLMTPDLLSTKVKIKDNT